MILEILLPLFIILYWFSEGVATQIHQCTVNTSVMVINQNNCEPMWKEWKDNKEKIYKSF